jgi:hypothetical protein
VVFSSHAFVGNGVNRQLVSPLSSLADYHEILLFASSVSADIGHLSHCGKPDG